MIGEKQNFRICVICGRRPGRGGCGHDEQRRSRFAPAREIEKIVVGPVTIKIIRPFRFVGSEQEHHAAIGFASQALAAHPVVGVGLAIEGPRKLADEKKQPQRLAHPESHGLWFQIIFPLQLRSCLPQ